MSMTALRASLSGAALAAVLAAAQTAYSEPYRLRSNVFAGSHARAPAGLITLDADSTLRPWLSAEAVVWVGAGEDSEADAMIIAMHLRDPAGRAEAALGRILVIPGAVRPVHLDGVDGRVRGPWDTGVELFGGVPVQPGLGAHAYDWALGGRLSRALGDRGSAGIAYLQRRARGRLDDEELGLDTGVAATPWLDIGARVAYDLIYPGVSDAQISASLRRRGWRLEAFAGHRSPARILPATSLFSVLGDVPARSVGGRVTWRPAPRLDVLGSAAGRAHDEDLGAELLMRAHLRLDDRGARALSVELRRDHSPGSGWTGARTAARLPMDDRLSLAAELELVIPDHAGDRGAVWPWALVAASWRLAADWLAAAAVEVSSSPEYVYRLDVIVRISRTWEVR